jgi:hypothetical protein
MAWRGTPGTARQREPPLRRPREPDGRRPEPAGGPGLIEASSAVFSLPSPGRQPSAIARMAVSPPRSAASPPPASAHRPRRGTAGRKVWRPRHPMAPGGAQRGPRAARPQPWAGRPRRSVWLATNLGRAGKVRCTDPVILQSLCRLLDRPAKGLGVPQAARRPDRGRCSQHVAWQSPMAAVTGPIPVSTPMIATADPLQSRARWPRGPPRVSVQTIGVNHRCKRSHVYPPCQRASHTVRHHSGPHMRNLSRACPPGPASESDFTSDTLLHRLTGCRVLQGGRTAARRRR